MENTLHQSWRILLAEEFSKPYFISLKSFTENAYRTSTVYPAREKIFAAFNLTPPEKVKIVIIGQDPYHEPRQAQGLAFYVPRDVKPPPSLRNIATELGKMPDLLSWADQGVLLLNATLTVEAHNPLSHHDKGWETFTDAAIKILEKQKDNLVFILWGSHARKKCSFIDRSRHCVIESAHPSPLSAYRGFFGSKPFERANAYLESHGKEVIAW